MVKVPLPCDEKERLKALRRYDLLDTWSETVFDRVTSMAAKLFDVPICWISLVDHDRIWFKSRLGFDVEQLPRELGLCGSAILQNKIYCIFDTREDERTHNHALVAGDYALRFYAAAPLRTHDGFNIGTFSIVDRSPRTVTDKQQICLRDFAGIVMDQIELRLAAQNQIQADKAERRRLYQKLIQVQKDETLAALASGIAHDCNNLLIGVVGAAELLRKEVAGLSNVESLVDDISYSGQRLSDLVKELLAYAGISKNHSRVLDVHALILESVKLARHSRKVQVVVQTNLGTGLWPIEAEPIQIQQVLLNICMNAFEAMSANGILTITTENAEKLTPWVLGSNRELPVGDYVHIAVSDNGCGMDEETQRQLFDLFFSTKGAGRGLGLAATLGIIRHHGGFLRVESKVGSGSTFHIYLPRTKKPLPQMDLPLVIPSKSGSGTILLIDDELMVRRTVKSMLESYGYKVLEAGDGETGIEICHSKKEQIHLVLLDFQLPNMSGSEVYERLKTTNPKAHIVLSSGHSREEALSEVGDRPGVNFLQKPYKPEQLVSLVRNLLNV